MVLTVGQSLRPWERSRYSQGAVVSCRRNVLLSVDSMTGRKGGPTTEPLSEEEELRLTNWINAAVIRDPRDPQLYFRARLVQFLFLFGPHPAVFEDPVRWSLRFDGKYLRWNRPKTWWAISFPVPEKHRSWVDEFLQSLPAQSKRTFQREVRRAGILAGVPTLSPRALRHTTAARLMERTGFNTAKALTGTTDFVLLGYGKRAALKSDLERIAREGY